LKEKYYRIAIILIWLCYVIYYIGRVNFSAAIPFLSKQYGYSIQELGVALSSFLFFYALGQLINGFIGDIIESKAAIFIGLIGIFFTNLFFSFFGDSIIAIIVIWSINGFFQSLGWGPIVKMLANWLPINKTGRSAALVASSYILGSTLSFLLSGVIILIFTWKFLFLIPSILAIVFAGIWWKFANNSPSESNPKALSNFGKSEGSHKISFRIYFYFTFRNFNVWVLGILLACINFLRYSFIGWSPILFIKYYSLSITSSLFYSALFPLFGTFGALLAGEYIDKSKKARKYLLLVVLIILFFLTFSFGYLSEFSLILSISIYSFIGFFTFAAHFILVGYMPIIIAPKQYTSSVTGFIDSIGYIGAGLSGIIGSIVLRSNSLQYVGMMLSISIFVASSVLFFSRNILISRYLR